MELLSLHGQKMSLPMLHYDILLDKIRNVCKLITVEGEFSEVFAHRDGKSVFFKLLQLKKKANLQTLFF